VDGAHPQERVGVRRRRVQGTEDSCRRRSSDRRGQLAGCAERADDGPLGGECVETADDGRVVRSGGVRDPLRPSVAVDDLHVRSAAALREGIGPRDRARPGGDADAPARLGTGIL
jgi:hypothetical protein